MEKTWKPMVAGILDIVAGALGGILSFLVILGIVAFSFFGTGKGFAVPNIPLVIGILAIPFFLISILAIIGGIFALQRKNWGVALAGSIAALLVSTPLGVLSIIFTTLSKNEFK